MQAGRLQALTLFLVTLITSALLAAPAALAVTKTYTLSADFSQGVLDGVTGSDVPDQLQLSRTTTTTFSYAWITNSGEGTISKIDTRTGVEVARYITGPNFPNESPARTAIDADGNCWVANQAPGRQGSVVKILVEDYIDYNGNGVMDTSTGPTDLRPWGEDERVTLFTHLGDDDAMPRALAIDRDGNLWVGMHNSRKYIILDTQTGQQIDEVEVAGYPFGAAIDANGYLWSANVAVGLEKIDTITRTPVAVYILSGAYGAAVDQDGYVWTGAYWDEGVIRFDPVTETYQHFPSGGYKSGTSTCIAPNGNVWLPIRYVPDADKVAKYDKNGNLLAIYTVGKAPCGASVDADGNIIIVCNESNDVYCLRESDGAVLWITPVGFAPYSFTDFTSYSTGSSLQKTGVWTVVCDGGTDGAAWGKVSWNGYEPTGTSIRVRVRVANTTSELSSKPWINVTNGAALNAVSGRYLEIMAQLSGTGEITPVLYDLTAETTQQPVNRPPDVSGAYPSPRDIWPASGSMIPITILGYSDPDYDKVKITITRITQDEPLDIKGVYDGDGVGTIRARVRAERNTDKKTGPCNGRVYEIFFSASDGKGGVSYGSVKVNVPRHVSPYYLCVDDGQNYDSTKR